MSDSDDDAAFASADEGDVVQTPPAPGATSETQKAQKEERGGGTTKSVNQNTQGRNEGKGKNKKKKKGGGKNTSKENMKPSGPPQTLVKEDKTKSEVETNKTVKSDQSKNDNKSPATSESSLKADNEKQDSAEKERLYKPTPDTGASESKVEKVSATNNTPIKSGDSQAQPDDSAEKERLHKLTPDTGASESKVEKVSATNNTPMKSGDSQSDDSDALKSPGDETICRTAEHDTTEDKVVSDAKSSTEEQPQQSSGGWGWGWGSSILKTATSSVSTFTHQVGDGFTTLMDTVETTLGVPNPEDLVDKTNEDENASEEKMSKSDESDVKIKSDLKTESQETDANEPGDTPTSSGGGGGWFSNISSLVQNTVSEGIGVLETIGSGSLDVMEKIGKKTYSVITEHDPGFRKARVFLGNKGDKPNLSALLRDAKEEASTKMEMEKESDEARQCHFGFLFDEYQGLAHLEALEILSDQSEKKVQALLHAMPEESITEIKPLLLKIKSIFELEDNEDEDVEEHDFIKLVADQLADLHLGTTPDKLNTVQEKSRKWIQEFYAEKTEEESESKSHDPKDIHKIAMQSFAELSSKSVEQFHKAGELILLKKDTEKTYEERSRSLAKLTQVLCTEIGILSAKFSQCLIKVGEEESKQEVVNPLVTNIYLEATNSSTYIQDAFQLLLPVLQSATIQNSIVLQ